MVKTVLCYGLFLPYAKDCYISSTIDMISYSFLMLVFYIMPNLSPLPGTTTIGELQPFCVSVHIDGWLQHSA